MTFGGHLEELRVRIIRILLGVGVGAVVAFCFGDEIVRIILEPLWRALEGHQQDRSAHALKPAESFLVYVKISFFAGAILASPYCFYQVWRFIAAGLYDHEKRYIRLFGPMSLGLFAAGVAFCFFVVIPISLRFLIWFSTQFPAPAVETVPENPVVEITDSDATIPILDADPKAPKPKQAWIHRGTRQFRVNFGMEGDPDVWAFQLVRARPDETATMVKSSFSLSYYVSFVTTMCLAFGIGFQSPLVVVFLAWSGIVEVDSMKRARRYVVVGIVAAAAILTPPDIQSQILLAVPMWGLFELGLVLAVRMPKRFSDETDAEIE
jgi:Sec-independent protein secretion pathway component TatC